MRYRLTDKGVRGFFGVLLDILSFLRIYRQRDFWVQIAAMTAGVFLWIMILPGAEVIRATAAVPPLMVLNFIMTNIVWAISKKPYSCVIGGSIGYGLYNLAVGAIVYHSVLTRLLIDTLVGVVYGFVFTWFAFMIFYFFGLVKKAERKEERTQSRT